MSGRLTFSDSQLDQLIEETSSRLGLNSRELRPDVVRRLVRQRLAEPKSSTASADEPIEAIVASSVDEASDASAEPSDAD